MLSEIDWTERCALCPGDKRCVPGDGPAPARVACIGEAPGQIEDTTGIPFSGPTGEEFNDHYLRLAGLSRPDVYITNTRKCRPPNNRKPTEKEIECCGRHFLSRELELVQPELIVLMGATACSLLDVDIDLDTHHGLPIRAELFGKRYWCVTMYHPALGLHDTKKMTPIMEDFERLREIVGGRRVFERDWLEGEEDYREVTDVQEIRRLLLDACFVYPAEFLHGYPVAVDTERTSRNEPWSIQFSVRPGTGYLIPHDARAALNVFGDEIWGNRILLHNAGQDIECAGWMGVEIRDFIDTMQDAWHLGNLPQGLKALAWRLCGMRMREFGEMVAPHGREKVLEWLAEARCMLEPTQVVRRKTYKSGKQVKKYSSVAHPGTADVERIFKHASKENSTYDPWKAWGGVSEWIREEIESELGPMPRAGIEHVPRPIAVRYACRDADAEVRVAAAMREGLREMGSEVVKRDWDK